MKRFTFTGMLILSFTLFGCNNEQASDDPPSLQRSGESSISITDASERIITFDKPPESIIALGNGEIDIIYALDGNVIGRPTTNGPPPLIGTEHVKEVGSTHGINLEIVTSLKPDVVLGNHPMNLKDLSAIEDIGAELILTEANSIDDIKNQIQLFGDLLGKKEKSKEIIQAIDKKVASVAHNGKHDKKRVLMIYGAPGTNMIALPNSLSGDILEKAGGLNIADDYPQLEAYPQYAQLNAEKIIESDPQIILFMGHGDPDAVKDSFIKEMQENPGWNKLKAVKNERFEFLPPDLFGTNPGTRVVEALDYLNNLFQEIES